MRGVVSDRLLRGGYSARVARARFPGVCVGLAMPLLLGGVLVSSATLSVACFVLFYFIFSLTVVGYWTMPLELGPRVVGAVGGVMNTSGNFAGIFGPMVAGFIIAQTGSWGTLFYVAAACDLVSSAIFTFLVRTEPITVAGVAPAAGGEQAEAGIGLGH